MQIHNLKNPNKKRKKRIGRGGKRGTYSGKGMKGQKSRAGHRIRPQLRDIIKKIPKRRGYRMQTPPERTATVNVGELDKKFGDGEIPPRIFKFFPDCYRDLGEGNGFRNVILVDESEPFFIFLFGFLLIIPRVRGGSLFPLVPRPLEAA